MAILSRVARLLNWEPVGKAVNIRIDESSNPAIVGTELTATVVSIKDNGAFVLRLTTPIAQGEKTIQEVIAYPRHTGYDIFRMAFGAIAVDLSSYQSNDLEQRFALALVNRLRS